MVNPSLRSIAKHLQLFLLFLTVGVSASAQKYTIGLKAGGLVSWNSYANRTALDTVDRKLSTGFAAGAFISFPMKGQFDLVLEGGYAKRTKRTTFMDGSEWTNITTFRMVDMAMLLRKSFSFRLEKNVPATWYVNLGPEISYVLSGSGRYTPGNGVWVDYIIDYESETSPDNSKLALPNGNKWLFGMGLGAGIIAPLRNSQSIGAELRFSYGHTYLSSTGFVTPAQLPQAQFGFQDTFKTNIKALTLSITYSLNFDVQRMRRGKSTLDRKVKSKKVYHKFRR